MGRVRTKRLALVAFILCFYALPLLSWTPSCILVYLTWDQDPSTTMHVHWISPPCKEKACQVYYTTDVSKEWTSKDAVSQGLPNSGYILHHAELTGLQADSIYSFRLGDYAEVFRFRTMPATLSRPVRFVEGGDYYHNSISLAEPITQQMASQDPDFAIWGGDIAYSCSPFTFISEKSRRWLRLLNMWQKTMVRSDGCLVPIVAVIGNHDVVGRYDQPPSNAVFFYALFCPGKDRCYRTLDFGDYLSLFLLDSGHTADIAGAQRTWLEEQLTSRPQVPHRFAAYHVPAYPSVRELDAKKSPDIRQHWVPLFEQYRLPIAFEHHDHAYKRTHPIRDGKVDQSGVVYLGDGALGCKPRGSAKNLERWYIAEFEVQRHFILADLQPKERSLSMINEKGEQMHRYEQQVAPVTTP
ncbi:MAG: metallophosphoesterase family protein [Chlamydiia bacterium]|nr:metallophosphoesterase family protein [Chlamydiia bacterium]